MTRPICVIGNLNVDLVMGTLADWPEHGTETFFDRCELRPGGSAGNTALALRRLGMRSGLVSATGTDTLAELLSTRFDGPLDRIGKIEGQTGISVGVLHDDAERSFLSFDGHLGQLDLAKVLALLEDWPIAGSLVLVSGGFAMPGLMRDQCALLDHLRLEGAEIAIDPGWPGEGWTGPERRRMLSWARASDHVLLNDKELTGLAGTVEGHVEEAATAMETELPDRCRLVVKRGAAGASLWQGGSVFYAEAPRTEPFDTVGAGDAFNAGYLGAVAAREDLSAALRRGCIAASRLVSQFPRGTGALETDDAA